MKYYKYYLYILIALAAIFVNVVKPAATNAFSIPTADLLITEVQTTNDSAGQEFIEIYNPTDQDINLQTSSWKLQHFTSKSVVEPTFSWSTTRPAATIILTGIVPAHGHYVVASVGYNPGGIEPDQVYNARLSDEGGGLRLVKLKDSLIVGIDQLAWHKDAPPLTATDIAVAAPAKSSIERVADEDYLYINELIGVPYGFMVNPVPTPKAYWQNVEVEPPDDIEPNPVDTAPLPDVIVVGPLEPASEYTINLPEGATNIEITELLPNPARPLIDSVDEYIELYNPNEFTVDLTGFKVEAGLNNSYKHTLPSNTVIAAKSYLILTSGNTSLSLSNSGGRARLLDTAGSLIYQTESYQSAPDGQAWAMIDGLWQWTLTPTPASPNTAGQPPGPVIKLAEKLISKKTITPKKVSAKTSAKKSIKAPTKAKPKKVNAVKAATVSRAPEVKPVSQLHGLILASVGGLAVAYACYEYRGDIANRIYRLRNYRKGR